MVSPCFEEGRGGRTRGVFSCCRDFLLHRECSSLSSADFRIAITLSRPIKVMPMVHHTPTPVLMPKNSRASMCTGSSTASGTIYQEAPQAFAEAVIDVDSY